MKAVISCAIALMALVASASPAKAQGCGEGNLLLCGFVWNDANGDGIQNDDPDMDPNDGDQSAINDIKVSLFVRDAVNNEWDFVLDTVTTDGLYVLSVDKPGLYKVVVDAPTGTDPTLTSQGSDNNIDSDGVNDAGGGAAEVTLGNGGVPSQELDFGFRSTGVVSPGTGTPDYRQGACWQSQRNSVLSPAWRQ